MGSQRRDILRKMLEEMGVLSKSPKTRARKKAGYRNKSVEPENVMSLPRIRELDVPVETIALENRCSREESWAVEILEELQYAG